MPQVIEVTDQTFDAEVVQSDKLVVAEFYTQFCPVCKRLSPIFEELSDEYGGKVKFVRIGATQARETASKFAVMAVPTILLLKSGKELARHLGFADKKKLAKLLDANP